MKQLLQQYAAYNMWANQKMIDVVKTLKEEQVQQEIVSSFSSIYKTLLHYWTAESLWHLRMLHQPHEDSSAMGFAGSTAELCNNLLKQSEIWNEWIVSAKEEELQQNLSYKNLAGESFEQPVYLLLHHVFNHSTFHRGQLITMFRQLGVSELPSTDFTTFTRLIGKGKS
jgi:uncharacterized damage-inducible protein DinB